MTAPTSAAATPPGRLVVPPTGEDPDELLLHFAGWAEGRGLALYPHQEEALLELVTGANVILSTPTGSGKSLVALGAHLAAMAAGRRTFYTAPIKALVSEKFFALCEILGAENVGMMTGDAAVNAGAPVVCCTAEVLANIALRQGRAADVCQVVMDEFHFYAEADRGWAWQVPLIELPQAQFLLMSATLGDVTFFKDDLTRRTGRPTAVVANAERPIPLFFEYAMTPLHETIEELLHTNQAPVYVVHFTQAAALERAQALTSVQVATREQRDRIAEAIGAFRFTAGFGRTLSRLLRHGIGVHHAGMLPRYRRLVEQLAQAGLLKVICGTDTLGVGINVPIRTVMLTALSKYDGTRVRHLKAREFHQIAGRAGRAGYDTAGTVVVQAPDHEIENERMLAKAGDDPKKRRKVVRKKPPEGTVSWTKATFERLVAAEPEPLTSHFQVTFALLLNVIARPGDAFTAMRHLLEDNHEPRAQQRKHIRRAITMFRSLLAAGVVERLPEPDAKGRSIRIVADLQLDFALNQPLSPFALAAIELLDRESPTYALDVVSVIEATLEDPRQILAQQQFKARGEAVAAMKMEGIEYEERMELLEDVEYPKPLRDLLEGAYEIYRGGHPWVGDYAIKPKSVVRDLFERGMSFGEFVGYYGLARGEGLVLRYLADAFRALRQTVPDEAKTEEVGDLVEWLGELVRQTDSSLLTEWEQLVAGLDDVTGDAANAAVDAGPPPVTRNARAFRVQVRNALFRRVELASLRKWWDLGLLDAATGWDADAWAAAVGPYYEEHGELGTGPDARGPAFLVVAENPELDDDELAALEAADSHDAARDRSEEGAPDAVVPVPAARRRVWRVRQVFDDPAGDRDWGFTALVDLDASDAAGSAVVRVVDVGRL
ncbi:MAG: DUF3516 domain-containing protein [Kineosporiaceae bacterium]